MQERLKQKTPDLFSTLKRNILFCYKKYTLTILVRNKRSLSKHVDDIVSDDRIIKNDIKGFIET